MAQFIDIRTERILSGTRYKGSFAEVVEKELDKKWNFTAQEKAEILASYDIFPKKKLQNPISQLESDLVPILANMEHTGICVKKDLLEDIGERIEADKDILEENIHKQSPSRFNINSPKQIQEIFAHIGIPLTKKNKTGYSVDNDVLEDL